jgi:hypothetical protein
MQKATLISFPISAGAGPRKPSPPLQLSAQRNCHRRVLAERRDIKRPLNFKDLQIGKQKANGN